MLFPLPSSRIVPVALRGTILLLCAVALALATSCTGRRAVREESPASEFSRPVPRHFFSMNGIQPFHDQVFAKPAERDGAWEDMRRRLRMMKSLGVTSVRVDMWWTHINPEKSVFDFTTTDRIMDEITAAGLAPYPIFCYNSAWGNDRSPDSADERELFGDYVFEMVNRYKERVDYWEVWNEPDLVPFWTPTPDARLYAELLKVAYRRAKEADPECTVVGMCMSRADTDFLELAYRTGVAGSFDALSFHHYDSQEEEAVLEQEIRRLRRVMDRYGDGEKPILITELGLSTGKSALVREMTEREQAAWIVKKHLCAQAEGVERFYYFKMTDDGTSVGEGSDGYWGLFDGKYEPKLSKRAYNLMAERLAGAEFLGRGFGGSQSGDVEFQLYRRDTQLFAIAWIRRSGPGRVFRIPSAVPAAMEDLEGKSHGEAMPEVDQYGHWTVPVSLTPEPVYLLDLPPSVLALANIRFNPPVIHLSPGVRKNVSLVATNGDAEPLALQFDRLGDQFRKHGLRVGNMPGRTTILPGETFRRTVTLELPVGAPEFAPFRLRIRGGEISIFHARPMTLELAAQRKGKALALSVRTQNLLEGPEDIQIRWAGHPDLAHVSDAYRGLAPGASGSSTHLVSGTLGEHRLVATARAANGATQGSAYSIYGQPLLVKAPTVDGDLTEWRNLPAMTLLPSLHQITPDRVKEPRAETDLSGRVWVSWTPDAMHIAAEVQDPTPMLAPYDKGDLWKGDGLEFYLGFDGPTARTQYGPRDYHFGLSPGDGTKAPHLWNWNPRAAKGATPSDGSIPGGRIAARRTANGYVVEASIPASEFLVKSVKSGTAIAFNVHLNGRSTLDQEVNDTILIWNGYLQDWRDPSRWGTAWILAPGSAKAPQTR